MAGKDDSVPESDVSELESMLTDDRLTDRMKLRFRIILLRADMVTVREIARDLDCSPTTVNKWLDRYRSGGIQALQDERPHKTDGPLARRRVYRSLKGAAERLIREGKGVAWSDLQHLLLVQLREEPDDDERSPHATHTKAKVEMLRLLKDVKIAEERDTGGGADDFFDV